MKKIFLIFLVFIIGAISLLGSLVMPEPLKIGATYMNLNNPYFVALNNSIEQVINANGDILIARDPSQNQARQNDIVCDMIDEGIDILILQPVDWKGVQVAINACNERNIPIIVVDSKVYNSENILFNVLSDNYKAGYYLAEDILRKKESANILLIHDTRINSIVDRVAGLKDGLAKNKNVRIVEAYDHIEGLEQSMSVTEHCLLEELDFDVVVGANDPTALGALAALQKYDADRDVLVYGVDGSPDAKRMIAKGYMEGTSAQKPQMIGRITAENLYKYLKGEPVEKEILVNVEFIGSDSVSSFNIAGWQ